MPTPYITLAKIKAGLPADITAQLLDDQNVGSPDAEAWAQIQAAVQTEIDGKIAQRYTLPLAEPLPLILANAAFILAAELCYQRRGYFAEANPWTKRADSIRGTKGQQGGQEGLLDRIAAGTEPLYAAAKSATPKVSVISAPARTSLSGGGLLC